MNRTTFGVFGLASLLLAGCSQLDRAQQHPYISGQAQTPAHAVQVRPVAYRFTINLAGRQLDKQDRQALTDFLRSHGPLINQRLVIVQQGAVDERRQLERWMKQLGIAAAQVRYRKQAAGAVRQVQVTTEYFVARTPDCPGNNHASGTPVHQQSRSPSFGCATASNLAMMVSDPRELVKGKELGPASGARASNAMRLYLQHGVTSLSANNGLEGVAGNEVNPVGTNGTGQQ
ncbi:MAG: CpaD family pilus assembly protein [Marinobacterium sp.]|nr:CpaD family pilus assembly protein [Marinobacterium sp.]